MTKKIIDGKRYDTDTAIEVAKTSNGLGSGDFKNFSEKLYRTKRGNWFTCGSGGPLSSYATRCGDGYSGSSDVIRAMSANEARDWLERENETYALEEYFSDSVEDA
jgi:hypothetical protein